MAMVVCCIHPFCFSSPKFTKGSMFLQTIIFMAAYWIKYHIVHFCLSMSTIKNISAIYVCVARRRPGSLGFNTIWAYTRETLTFLIAKNKGADQPAHPRSLISAFIIRCLNSKETKSDISQFSKYFWWASTR